jgi:hypothetical protein
VWRDLPPTLRLSRAAMPFAAINTSSSIASVVRINHLLDHQTPYIKHQFIQGKRL